MIFYPHDWQIFCETKKYSSTVILPHADMMPGYEQNYWKPISQRNSSYEQLIFEKAMKHQDTMFVVVNPWFNIIQKIPNLYWLNYGHPWHLHKGCCYSDLSPVSEKQFDTRSIWICLNRNKRIHRYLIAMYLLGNDLESRGYLTVEPSELDPHPTWQDWLIWWQYNDHHEINDISEDFPALEKGFVKIKEKIGYHSPYIPQEVDTTKNCQDNFRLSLSNLYKQSMIEIVAETTWQPDAGAMISEKYINTVYGFNFPILVGAKNSIQQIRNQGFDVFDDVIDHSYDELDSPTLRLVTALKKNHHLLIDFDQTKSLWTDCHDRMQANVDLANEIYKNSSKYFNEAFDAWKKYQIDQKMQ